MHTGRNNAPTENGDVTWQEPVLYCTVFSPEAVPVMVEFCAWSTKIEAVEERVTATPVDTPLRYMPAMLLEVAATELKMPLTTRGPILQQSTEKKGR